MHVAHGVLRCPKCKELMEEHEAKGHYGAKFLLFHCPQCSGIWVDKDVAFAVSRDSAVEVEQDVHLEEIPTRPRKGPIFCPRCGARLTEQTGGGLPKGLRIDYCTGCHGFWFDKGELMIYKSFLEEKRKQSMERLKATEEAQMRKKMQQSDLFDRSPKGGSSAFPTADFVFLAARIVSGLLRLIK
jgi:Zn-finger nucleic acid-binding protein